MRTASAENGITLIEVVILIVTTMALVGGLAPSISYVVLTAQSTAATTAMANIDQAINDILGDMNYTYLNYDGVKNSAQRALLIVSDGDIPSQVSGTGSATWQTAVNGTTYDFMERHLGTNTPGGSGLNAYPVPATDAGAGWRGTYLNTPYDPDPWGNRYMVNVQYLGGGAGGTNDVVVYSAGPDEEIDAPFTNTNWTTIPSVDDDLFVIQEG